MTDYRNLDDYIDKCNVAIARRNRRATATVLDQRALLAASGGADVGAPSLLTRVEAGCLRCLTSVVEISELLGRVRKDLVPQQTTPALYAAAAPPQPEALSAE